MTRPAVPRLLLVTPSPVDARVVERARLALRGAPTGAVAVQLRDKGRPARELVALARALRAATADAGALLLVNGRLDVALAASADGVHLPERGVPVAEARRLLGPDGLVGRSCHDTEGLTRAGREGADYAVLGPVGEVPGKGAPLGVDGFGRLCAGASLPTLALGGVTPALVPALARVGAAGIAVVRDVFHAPDPGRRVLELLRLLDRAELPGG